MQMRPDIQIQSMIKAMTDTVLPALDPENKLAQEQARLVLGMLALMRRQLPIQFAFDCDELQRLIELSQALRALDIEAADEALLQDETQALNVLAGARTSPADVLASVRHLRSVIGQRVTRLYALADGDARARLQQLVLRSTREQLQRDRALLVQQGWEPDPDALPSIETLLGLPTAASQPA
ncbi:hypothetical protein N5O88_09740 [Pseudomonas sp. GD03721]|uniref:hypothetical protein n=1 Tax=Pseudomonas TaxID=286 RepID=UPI00093BC4AB|nr:MULTISPECIES: hypothetical protein [Pseudomonas]MDH0639344.1 hypothetical protein [Pseudomonas sp. GD03860]MDH1440455.1 hypothetical protein [Pseudomonas sp. GD03722]WGG03457.1 hypothetical protein N5O88_09740 [Pseudomonas sp. GD03721]WGG07625.1 hypothetical protein N5O87_09750 [Pseudomonas sp. GD03919]